MTKANQPYDYICFTDLVYESNITYKKKVEGKIKRRLKYYEAGPYDQERVDYIRNLKIELHKEISNPESSIYFNKIASKYAELKDFDVERMAKDYNVKYDSLDTNLLTGMINFAVYLYHLR